MDLKLVREEAIEGTTRFFWDNQGFVPDQDSDEWEAEYRRQFELAKNRHAGARPAAAANAPPPPPPREPTDWAELTGAPTQIRWAAALRADRIAEIRDPGIRGWLATTWTKAKSWVDTGEMPTPVFLQRVAPHYAEYRKQADERARVLASERQAREAAADQIRREVEAAGITVEGLIELIDICDRLPPAPLGAKLAELDSEGRTLRIFETADPAMLMVLEKSEAGRSEYGIERDEGLVADLGAVHAGDGAVLAGGRIMATAAGAPTLGAKEAMEQLNAEAAPLHIWLRTQANMPAQRPWFRETGLDASGRVATGRVGAAQLKPVAHHWRWHEHRTLSRPHRRDRPQCRRVADRICRTAAVPVDQPGARRAVAGDLDDALRGVDL